MMRLFGRREQAGTTDFVLACPAAQLAEDAMTTVKIDGRKVILTRTGGRVYAFDSVCPHAAADLSQGSLRSWQICCHEHDYCFDIRNGRIVWPEDEVYRLRRYEAKEEAGQVYVRLAPPP